MRIVLTIIVVALVAIAAALTVIYTGAYNVAATDPHFPVVRWALDTTFKNSVRLRAADIPIPERTAAMVEQGAKHYATMCAMCHGTPGGALPEIAQHMRNPSAAPLRRRGGMGAERGVLDRQARREDDGHAGLGTLALG